MTRSPKMGLRWGVFLLFSLSRTNLNVQARSCSGTYPVHRRLEPLISQETFVSARFSHDGLQFAILADNPVNSSIYLADTISGQRDNAIVLPFAASKKPHTFQWSGDGSFIVGCYGLVNSCFVWDPSSRAILHTLDVTDSPGAVAISEDSQTIVLGTSGSLNSFDVSTGNLLAQVSLLGLASCDKLVLRKGLANTERLYALFRFTEKNAYGYDVTKSKLNVYSFPDLALTVSDEAASSIMHDVDLSRDARCSMVGSSGKLNYHDVDDAGFYPGRMFGTLEAGNWVPAEAVAWSRNDILVATGDTNGWVKIWKAEHPWSELHTFKDHTSNLFSVDFDAASSLVVTVSSSLVVVYHTQLDRARWLVDYPAKCLAKSLSWSSDGNLIATSFQPPAGTSSNTIFDPATLTQVKQFTGGLAHVFAFSPDGTLAAFASTSSEFAIEIRSRGNNFDAVVYDFDYGAFNSELEGYKRAAMHLAWHPDPSRKELVVGTKTGLLVKFSSSQVAGEAIYQTQKSFARMTKKLCFSPSADWLVVAMSNELVWLDVQQGYAAEASTIGGISYHSCSFSPSGDKLAVGLSNSTVVIFDVSSKASIKTITPTKSSTVTLTVRALDWHPHLDNLIAVGHEGNELSILNWLAEEEDDLILETHNTFISWVAWRPDGKQLAFTSFSGEASSPKVLRLLDFYHAGSLSPASLPSSVSVGTQLQLSVSGVNLQPQRAVWQLRREAQGNAEYANCQEIDSAPLLSSAAAVSGNFTLALPGVYSMALFHPFFENPGSTWGGFKNLTSVTAVCPAGQVAKDLGQLLARCESCPAGFFTPFGSTSCIYCNGETVNQTACRACPPNSAPVNGSCQCFAKYYSPSVAGQAVRKCVGCPRNAYCVDPSGTTLETIAAASGFYRADKLSTGFIPCATESSCCSKEPICCTSAMFTCAEGNQCTCSPGQTCVAGYTGPMCGVCQAGWGRSGTNECSVCPATSDAIWLIAVLGAAAAVLLAVGFVWYTFRPVAKRTARDTSGGPAALLMLAVSSVQVNCMVLSLGYEIPNPLPSVLRAQGALKGVGDSLLNFSCALGSLGFAQSQVFTIKIVIWMVMPLVLTLAVKLFAVLFSYKRRRKSKKAQVSGGGNEEAWGQKSEQPTRTSDEDPRNFMLDRIPDSERQWQAVKRHYFLSGSAMVFFVVQTELWVQSLVLFECTPANADKTEFRLRYDLSFICYDSRHYWLMGVLGAPALVVYLIVPFAGGFVYLRRWLRSVKGHQGEKREERVVDVERYRFNHLFFLVQGLKPERWYWWIVIGFRKVLLSAIVIFGGRSKLAQLVCINLVLLGCTVLHVQCLPYESALLNTLETFSLALSAAIFSSSTAFLVQEEGTEVFLQVVSWCLVVLCLGFVLAIVIVAGRRKFAAKCVKLCSKKANDNRQKRATKKASDTNETSIKYTKVSVVSSKKSGRATPTYLPE